MTDNLIPDNARDILLTAIRADRRVGDTADAIVKAAFTGDKPLTYSRDMVAMLARRWAGVAPDFKAARGSREKAMIDKARVALIDAAKRAGLEEDAAKPVTLRVTLSGEGGGSAVVAPDHALYGALVAMIAGE